MAAAEALPELASVPWRRRVDARRLERDARLWLASTLLHVVPFVAAGVAMVVVQPLALPVTLVALAHAWVIPELYAQRGANVVRPAPGRLGPSVERRAVGLLGDLIGHEARELHARTGLVLERGVLGRWLIGPTGALLLRRGRLRRSVRVHCFCVGVSEPALPLADRTAHLLLALRADEQGFATVANRAFCGARWRVRRRVAPGLRPALDRAARELLDTRDER